MVQHNVFFWVKDGVSESDKKSFEQGMRDFTDKVEEIHMVKIGVPAATEERDVVDHSFTYGMFVWFDSKENHDIYQSHPEHDKFIADFSPIWEKVKVYDVELR